MMSNELKKMKRKIGHARGHGHGHERKKDLSSLFPSLFRARARARVRARSSFFLFLFLLLITHYSAFSVSPMEKEDFTINLRDPEFSHGVIFTEKGGIITAEGMRIQAQKISYTNRIENGHPVQRVEAEGDLLVEYGEHSFVGEKLEYDFVTQSGYLTEGKTYVGVWFLGGDRIELRPDKGYFIYGAFITTCESQDNTWDISAGLVNISNDHLLSAKNIRFRFGRFPIFWLPSFKSNLKYFTDPPIRYKVKWDKGLGPRATMRYRIYSWEDFDLFFRLDYRLKRGFGGALESKYVSPNKNLTFLTKSYGAHDKVIAIERGNKRFRLQGLYDQISNDEKTKLYITYDKFSDDKMPRDFKSDDFEVNTQKRSILIFSHQEDNSLANVRFQPRLNPFQSLDQELPFVNIAIRPFSVLGILSENRVNASYLDYTYNKFLHNYVHNLHAARIETTNQIYRPFQISHFTLTPRVGIDAIFYNNNQFRSSIGQGVVTYGGVANTRLRGGTSYYTHLIEPYITYDGITNPLAKLYQHYIFNIDDGYSKVNLARFGVKNTFYSKKCLSMIPPFYNDTYLYLFFHDKELQKTLAKVYSSFGMNLASVALKAGVEWNVEEKVWDYTNARTDWTVNENFACGVEYRHRSRFDWRKSDHENYILDFARPVSEMLHSPLSDGRNTLLTRFYLRLSPKVTCQFQSHTGWGRNNEPGYTSVKLDLFTLLACQWQLRLSMQYDKADGFSPTASISLVE